MKPRKPYAFITFSTAQESIDAFNDIHGKTMQCPEQLSVPNVTFYLSFIKEGMLSPVNINSELTSFVS